MLKIRALHKKVVWCMYLGQVSTLRVGYLGLTPAAMIEIQQLVED